MHPQRIAIVGLGVAGATAGMLLARQGHNVTVFEQTASPGPVGAGVLLQPSGQLVLEGLGLLDEVIACAEPIERLHARTDRGRTLTDLPYGELVPPARAYGVLRGELFTVLHQELLRTGADFRLGIRAVKYLTQADCVQLFDAQDRTLGDFDCILACDGARSALRSGSGVRFSAREYPHGAMWAMGPCTVVRRHLLQVARGTRQLCGLLPTGNGRCSLFWSLRTTEREAFFARGFDAWRREAIALCPESREIFDAVRSFEQTRFTNYMHVRMPVPFDRRCLFLGDAAHAMSPHLGQGINLALIDAFCFAHAAEMSDDFTAACRHYTAMRRSHLRFYSAVTYLLSPFFQSRGIIKAALRNIFLPVMPGIPPIRKRMLVTMAGLRGGVVGGRLRLPPLSGSRAEVRSAAATASPPAAPRMGPGQ